MKNYIFQACTACQTKWKSQPDFLSDPNLSIVGLQVSFEDLIEGLILFNHSCGTTFSLPVSQFQNLYDGTIFPDRATDSDECPAYCLNKEDLRPCPAQCECAFVREIVQKIKKWPKNTTMA